MLLEREVQNNALSGKGRAANSGKDNLRKGSAIVHYKDV